MFFFAEAIAFFIASGTPFAFPNPNPIFPSPSPIAAKTEKDIVLPPLVVLETLEIFNNFSWYCFSSLFANLDKWNPPLSKDLEA